MERTGDRTTENKFQICFQVRYPALAKMEEAAWELWDFRTMSASVPIPTQEHYVKVRSINFVAKKGITFTF